MSEQLEKLLASPFEIFHEESFNVSQCGMSLFLIPLGVGFVSLNGCQSSNPKKRSFGGYENPHKVCYVSAENQV